MANISKEVWVEDLEKLPDGTYKKKNHIAKARNGTTFDEHLAESATQAHLAKNIGLEDTEGKFTATEVEGAMSELFTNVSSGKDLVGGAITDVDDSVVIPTEPTFNDLANGVGQIRTGKKWASGTVNIHRIGQSFQATPLPQRQELLTINGLDFTPEAVFLVSNRLFNISYTRSGYVMSGANYRMGQTFSSYQLVEFMSGSNSVAGHTSIEKFQDGFVFYVRATASYLRNQMYVSAHIDGGSSSDMDFTWYAYGD